MIFRLLTFFITVFLLAGCSAKTPPHHSAEEYFQEGEKLFESRLYQDAIASWEKVRDTYYSPELNMLAELKIAEAYYLSERYPEAAAAYTDFIKQHPNNPRLPTAMFQLGMSHYQQKLSADRDQTAIENALQVFQNFRQRYPNDPQVPEVDGLIRACQNRLAEHEVYVAWFYQRTRAYQASINRLEATLKKYPGYPGLDEAYFYLGRDYLKLGKRDKATEIFNILFKRFPSSEYSEDAQELLAKEG